MQLAFSEPREPDLQLTTKGHGRLEQRAVWVSSDLAGYTSFPGLSNVIKVSKRVKHLKRGEWVESEQYAVTSLSDIDPKGALSLVQGHREQVVPRQGRQLRGRPPCDAARVNAVLDLIQFRRFSLTHPTCDLVFWVSSDGGLSSWCEVSRPACRLSLSL